MTEQQLKRILTSESYFLHRLEGMLEEAKDLFADEGLYEHLEDAITAINEKLDAEDTSESGMDEHKLTMRDVL